VAAGVGEAQLGAGVRALLAGAMTRRPGGHLRSNRPVSSATQAPPRWMRAAS
jgi:hypothetical protein